MTNPFARIHNEHWVAPVSIFSCILGFMLVTAWVSETTRRNRMAGLPEQRPLGRDSGVDTEKFVSLQQEVDKLRKQATSLEKALSENGQSSQELNKQLQDIKAMSGLTELEGPGVKITLKDNPKAGPMPGEGDLIHDYDILRVTNELFSAGAEAVSVNGQRLVSTSSIRCAGPIILVDGVKIAAPFIISCLGDPEVLFSAFTMNGGVMTELAGADQAMVQVSKEKSLRVPAYLGSTTRKFSNVPKVTK